MPRGVPVTIPEGTLKERSVAFNKAYQAVSDAIDTDVDSELVDSAFLHPLTRARDYLGKESGKMARQLKAIQKEQNAQASPPTSNGTDKASTGAGAAKS